MITHLNHFHASTQFAFALAAAMFASTPSEAAEAMPTPSGEIILTISGAIANTNDGELATFDREMLESLPATNFTTSTIWTEGNVAFVGVELDDILEYVGATGSALHAIALNDYKVDIPVADAQDGGPIIAYELDGAVMSRRQKGPLWIVYPYDSKSEYQSEVIYSRSIWQLDRIAVIE